MPVLPPINENATSAYRLYTQSRLSIHEIAYTRNIEEAEVEENLLECLENGYAFDTQRLRDDLGVSVEVWAAVVAEIASESHVLFLRNLDVKEYPIPPPLSLLSRYPLFFLFLLLLLLLFLLLFLCM